jgi:CubicO group peptidase (beta-lactamase class C family)
MRDTGYDRFDAVLADRAIGYAFRGPVHVHAPYVDMSIPAAAGALYSTADDLLAWARALDAGTALPADVAEAMFRPQAPVPPGAVTQFRGPGEGEAPVDYGYGWFVGRPDGRPGVWHTGSINGFAAYFSRLPGAGATVLVWTNTPPPGPRLDVAIGRRLEAILADG